MTSFEPNAIIRGAQLTVVGAFRALQNPALFRSSHYRQAAIACCVGIAVHLLLLIPVFLAKVILYVPYLISGTKLEWDHVLYEWIRFFSDAVLQVPFLLMTLMSHITPTLDELFMESLRWADSTYAEKHKADDPATLRAMYYPNLSQWPTSRKIASADHRSPGEKIREFAQKNSKRTMVSIGVYVLSTLPMIGRFVYPAASFWAFRKEVGDIPASVIFGAGLVLPKRFMVMFFQSFYSSRSLMRELLRPYFKRIHFTPEQRRRWFFDREGVLFGFALGFYYILRTPFIGILMYGIAEASTAYLITKITDPPPPPPPPELLQGGGARGQPLSIAEVEFAESQTTWHNKKEFLSLPINKMDVQNAAGIARAAAKAHGEQMKENVSPLPAGKRFT